MIQKNLLVWIFALSLFSANGQQNPFVGSEKMVSQNYDFTNFDKISILDLDGVTEIEVGKPFSVETKIKDKYTSILEVTEMNGELTIVFKYTKDNNKYIENPNIKVKITCPSLANLYKRGNSNVSVSISNKSAFTVINEGNGSAILKGFVKQLSLKNDGNGRIDAKKLLADTVFVNSFGNGDIIVNAKDELKGERNGNGKIIQNGKAVMMDKR